METIPTAEEFLNDKVYITQDGIKDVHDSLSTVAETMIEFAKLHVTEALRQANDKVNYQIEYFEDVMPNKVLNAYSLDNIK